MAPSELSAPMMPALEHAGRDEQVACLRQRRPEGGEGESHDPDHEDAPVPEDIAQSSAREKQCRERDDVTGESPLQLFRCRMEVLADRGQCDVGDRRVHQIHERGHHEHGGGDGA